MHKYLFIIFMSIFANQAFGQEVWLFGIQGQSFTNQHRLKGFKIKHYLVDGGRDFELMISRGLSSNKAVAMKQMKARLKQHNDVWNLKARKSWQGAINAQSIGIEKIPAITFDQGKTVIYGLTDTAQAYQYHRMYLKNKDKK